LRAILLLALLVLLAGPVGPYSFPGTLHSVSAALSMPNPEYTLQANFNGWNFSQSSSTNPTIVSSFLFSGQILTANAYVVDGLTHSLAYYQPGTQPLQVSQFDICGPANTCLAMVSLPPSTPGALQFAFSSASTFELYCQFHPFQMHGKVFVYRSPDTNGDHAVNIIDLVAVALVFGDNSTSSGFRPSSDLNRDNVVNIVDLVVVAVNFGRTV